MSIQDEIAFQRWYKKHAEKNRLDPDPDDVRHWYDYRKAFKSGAKPDKSGHLPTKYKREGHPRRHIGGFRVE